MITVWAHAREVRMWIKDAGRPNNFDGRVPAISTTVSVIIASLGLPFIGRVVQIMTFARHRYQDAADKRSFDRDSGTSCFA
jgi:hypothetical protein